MRTVKFATGVDTVNCNTAMYEIAGHSPEYFIEIVGLSENVTRDEVRDLAMQKFPTATSARRVQIDPDDGSVYGVEPAWAI